MKYDAYLCVCQDIRKIIMSHDIAFVKYFSKKYYKRNNLIESW